MHEYAFGIIKKKVNILIYLKRFYFSWNETIEIFNSVNVTKKDWDLVVH